MIAAAQSPSFAGSNGIGADGRHSPVIDADYAVVAFAPSAPAPDDRLVLSLSAPPPRSAANPDGVSLSRRRTGFAAPEPPPKLFTQAGGVAFWTFGLLAAALAFWTAGGHALFLR